MWLSWKKKGRTAIICRMTSEARCCCLTGSGEIRESYGFDEFGQALFPEQERRAQPFGYTGYQMEEAGGLYYAQARRYDAGAGRFVSEDRERYRRFRWPKTLNQYIYCENNPTVYIDPSGNYIEDIYPTEPSRYAPVQVRISGNTITIDAYVDITGDINTKVGDMTTYDLAIERIETWAGTYENIYGNKVKVEVNVYEKNGTDGAQNLFRNKQEFLDIELRDGAGTAVVNRNGTWSIDNTGRITMYSSSSDGKPRDRKHYTDTIAHEFGHILGIDDGYEDKKYNTSRPVADMLEIDDMMRNNHMKKTHISDIDIQMMVIAASTNERQYFMTYGGHIQSKGVFIYEICDTD